MERIQKGTILRQHKRVVKVCVNKPMLIGYIDEHNIVRWTTYHAFYKRYGRWSRTPPPKEEKDAA